MLPVPIPEVALKIHRAGFVYALAAYGAWGILPIFWKQLAGIDAGQLLAHRLLWSAVFMGLLAWKTDQLTDLRRAGSSLSMARWFLLSAGLLGINYGTFIYAVVSDHILDASLGYFITPLVNVSLGAMLLGETLRRPQKVAVALGATAVAILAVMQGGLPWISLALAGSFGTYGLVRKRSPLEAMPGTTLELAVLAAPALCVLAVLQAQGDAAVGQVSLGMHGWLLATGVVTALPLIWFGEAARRLPLTTLGFAQYLAPSGQLLVGAMLYGEPLPPARLAAFALIWLGCALYSIDLWRNQRA